MNVLFTILTVLVLLASGLLTLIVLLQNGKGGGLASNFVAGNQTFGVRQTTDILEKITWGLAIFILVVSIIASFTYKSDKAGLASVASGSQEQTTEQMTDNESEGADADAAELDAEEAEVTNPTEE